MPSPRTSWHSSHSSPPGSAQPPAITTDTEKLKIQLQLQRQQQDSAADSAWLKDSEQNMGVSSRHPSNHKPRANGAQSKKVNSARVELDRTEDNVYKNTTSVVKSVITMSREVSQNKQADYVELVKSVGVELRTLLATVDDIIEEFPSYTHSDVNMAHKVLGSDMSKLVSAMKVAQKYLHTTMADQYKKKMLEAAHALALNAKILLEAVDSARVAKMADAT